MTDTVPTPPPAPRASRGMRILLAISLGLNLAVLGVAAGSVLHHIRAGDRPPVRDLGFGPFTEALSPADRFALLRAFAGANDGFRAERTRMKADMDAVLAALRAAPYDPAALDRAMGAQVDRLSERMRLGQTLLTARLQAMTGDERHAFADRLEQALSHPPRDHDHPPPPPGG